MVEFVDFTEITVVEIFFGDVADKAFQQRFVLGQNGAKQSILLIIELHLFFQLLGIARERREMECDI